MKEGAMDHICMDEQSLINCFTQQQQAFAKKNNKPYGIRKAQLQALRKVIVERQSSLMQAVSEDFGFRSAQETWLSEIFQLLSTIDYVLKHLKKWMSKEKRHTHMIFKPAKNFVYYQPLGVIGIVVPWNYPILLALSPLIYAIAAGNHCFIKMSELTPKLTLALQVLLHEVFDQKEVAICNGNAQFAQNFCALPFDHLFFTGSSHIAKKAMKEAANHLTPITLELGGKSPVIIDKGYPLKKAVKAICFAKCLNAGQTCIAPDYMFLHQEQLEAFIELMKQCFSKMYPQFKHNQQYTHLIHQQHAKQLNSLIEELANEKTKVIYLANFEGIEKTQKMPLILAINPKDSSTLMQTEIFGPILPIKTYQDISEVHHFITKKEKPLAAYLFSHNKLIQQQMIAHLSCGGLCINDILSHIAQHDLPFGGVGASGMGRYHAKEGFVTFSNTLSVHQRGKLNQNHLLYPPYGRLFARFKQFMNR